MEAERDNVGVAAESMVRLVLHETRTPLNAIRGFTDLLLAGAGGPLPAEALDFVGEVARAARALEGAVERLRGLAAAEVEPAAATAANGQMAASVAAPAAGT